MDFTAERLYAMFCMQNYLAQVIELPEEHYSEREVQLAVGRIMRAAALWQPPIENN